MKDNISPEEKLLRLIRGKKSAQPRERKSTAKISLHPKTLLKGLIHLTAWKGLSFISIQKIILITFAASCLYLIASFIYPYVSLRKIRLPQVTQKEIVQTKTEPHLQVKPLGFYLGNISGRSIFGRVAEVERPVGSVDTDLSNNLNLVGIISGENPQAIIEDKKAGRTYYLNRGQFIGEFQVEDIQEGRVILSYQGERFELQL